MILLVTKDRLERFTWRDSASSGPRWNVRSENTSSAAEGVFWQKHLSQLLELRWKVSKLLLRWSWFVLTFGVQRITSSAQWMCWSWQIISLSSHMPFLALTKQLSKLLGSYGIKCSVCMGSLSGSIRIKAQISRVSLLLNCWHFLGSPNLARLPIILWAMASRSGSTEH